MPSNEFSNDSGIARTSCSIPKEQKVIVTPVVRKTLDLKVGTARISFPKPGEVTVKIEWTGLCGSDPSFCVGPKAGFSSHNHIAGHEGIGHIVASHDVSLLDQPVAARYLTYACQTCIYCLRGIAESCPNHIAFPKDLNGTFQQYITVPQKTVIHLPGYVFDKTMPTKTSAYAAALCSGSAALKALRKSQITVNDVIVVIGVGGSIGHLIGMMAKKVFGAKVIGVDVRPKGEHPLLKSGDVCDRFLDAPENQEEEVEFRSNVQKLCWELRGTAALQRAADSVFSCSNRIDGFKNLNKHVCDGGSIIIVGGPSDGDTLELSLHEVLERQIRIEGSLMGGRSEMFQCLEYIRAGALTPYVTEIGLDEIPRYMQNFNELKNIGKTVARMQDFVDI